MLNTLCFGAETGLSLNYTCSRPIQTGRRHFKLSVDFNIVVLREYFALKSKQINGVFCAYQLDYVMVLQQSTSFRVFLIGIL